MVNIISDYVKLIDINTTINKRIMIITAISISNTIGDFFADTFLAKSGLGNLAFYSIFSN